MPSSRKRTHSDNVADEPTTGIKKDIKRIEQEFNASWTEHVSVSTGKKYYHNRRTGVSTFHPPPEFKTAVTASETLVAQQSEISRVENGKRAESAAKKDVRKQHADSRPASEPASEQTKTKREQSRGSSDETSKRRRVEEEIDRCEGTTSTWRSEGYGFISPADGGDDLFCHSSGITDGDCLVEGGKVTFERQFDSRKNKYRAVKVRGGCTQEQATKARGTQSSGDSNRSGGRQHRLPLRQPYLKWIKEGRKTVEGRINSGCPARMRAGDTILFTGGRGGSDSVQVTVGSVESFDTFEAMLTKVGVELCLPDYKRVGDAVRLYQSFPGYADKERRFGVLAIHIVDAV